MTFNKKVCIIHTTNKGEHIMPYKNLTIRYDTEDLEFINALKILKEHSINKSAFIRNTIIKESENLIKYTRNNKS